MINLNNGKIDSLTELTRMGIIYFNNFICIFIKSLCSDMYQLIVELVFKGQGCMRQLGNELYTASWTCMLGQRILFITFLNTGFKLSNSQYVIVYTEHAGLFFYLELYIRMLCHDKKNVHLVLQGAFIYFTELLLCFFLATNSVHIYNNLNHVKFTKGLR